ncbi:DUF6541 family protein [Xylanimonas sp. McL0601]|uniref:DUF6541 family protein n=1 Tax=Xylanimonas sp. McL0601 TaxID=3414739 RepID=UPI003CF1683C
MSWWSAADELVLAALWTLGPGALLALALGLRRERALFAAPLLSVALLAAWPVVLAAVGVPWSWAVAVAVTLVTAVAVWFARAALSRSTAPGGGRHLRAQPAVEAGARTVPSGRAWVWLVAAGVVVGGVLSAWPVARGMARPDLMPQTWDAVFHLNAVRWVLENANASSLDVGALTNPAGGSTFYPAAWHVLAALSTTGSVTVSTNAVALVVAGLVWPLGLAALAWAVVPRWPWLAVVAPVVGALFLRFPGGLLTWGTVWPNALAYALVPATVAATVLTLGVTGHQTREDRQPVAHALVAVAGLGAIALSQPNALLVYAVVVTPFVVVAAARATGHGPVLRRVLAAAGGLAWVAAWLVAWRMFASQVGVNAWQGTAGFRSGAVGALGDALVEPDANAWVLALVALGVVVTLCVRGARWLVVSLAGLAALAGLAQHPTRLAWLVQPWFADPNRLAGAVPIVSALVVAVGLCGLGAVVARLVSTVRRSTADGAPVWVAPAVAVLALAVVVAGTGGLRAAERTALLHAFYVEAAEPGRTDSLVSPDELAMLERLRGELTPGAALIGSPFSGAALAFAVADVDVVFPHMRGGWSPEASFLGRHFDEIGTDPRVCGALRDLDVQYFYTDTDVYFPTHRDHKRYTGLPDHAPGQGFELVDTGGTARVYRITACR